MNKRFSALAVAGLMLFASSCDDKQAKPASSSSTSSAAAPAPAAATPAASSGKVVIATNDSWSSTNSGTNSTKVGDAAQTAIDAAQSGPITITVTGNTDTRNSFGGAGDQNQQLSQDRANAAAWDLMVDIYNKTGKTPDQLGIKIEAVGAGSSNATVAGDCAACRATTMEIKSTAPAAGSAGAVVDAKPPTVAPPKVESTPQPAIRIPPIDRTVPPVTTVPPTTAAPAPVTTLPPAPVTTLPPAPVTTLPPDPVLPT